MRSLIRKGEEGFNGWGCSECEWVHPYPRLVPKHLDPGAEALRAYEAHECQKHSKRKPRGNVNEAAARVVREASEKT